MSEHKPKQRLSRTKRWVLLGALVFFAAQLMLPVVAAPRQAQALFGLGDLSITIGDIPRLISDAISKALKTASDIAFKNVLRSYLNNLAYNIATEIATGEKGQQPLFVTNPEELLKNAGDAAAGDFLDSIASDWVGQSQCMGYPDSRCKTDSTCDPPIIICPAGVSATDCSSSRTAMTQCLNQGCQVVTCTEADIKSGGLCAGNEAALPKGFASLGGGAAQCVKNFSLCDLSADTQASSLINVQLNILARNQLLGGGSAAQVSGRCPLTSIIDNYDEYRSSITNNNVNPSKQYLVEFSKSFNPNATQLGAYLEILDEAENQSIVKINATEFAQSLAGEFKPVTTAVSGAVKTPASLLRNAATTIFGKSIDQYLVQTGSAVADAVGVFTNTLTSKLIERYLFGLDPATSGGGSSRGLASFLGGSSPGVTAAKFLFNQLQQTTYTVSGTTDILSSLSSCPNENDPTPDTCAIDSRFRTAIEQQLTVREAVAQGLIDGSKTFGYDANGLEPDYFNGYPYRSLIILRKYRIIPVGWELAAQYIKNFAGGSYSLNTLIADYDNVSSPFYHLIDPNWVLKSPEVFCRRSGAGEQVIVDTPIRSEDTNNDGTIDTKDAAISIIQRQSDYCADEQLCLKQNPDGSCAKYGYCLEDENIWRFNGTECNPAFASCQALTRADGSTVSYLLNTVETNGCNSSNAGCTWYCTSRAADGSFICNGAPPGATGAGNTVALNAEMQTCNAEGAGCTSLIPRKNSGANLLQNSGLELFGADALGDGIKDSGIRDAFVDYSVGSVAAGCGLEAHATSESVGGFTAARLVTNNATCAPPTGTPLDGGHYFWAAGPGAQPNLISYGEYVGKKSFSFSLYAKTAEDDPDCAGGGGQLALYSAQYISTGPDFQNFANIQASSEWTRYTGSFTLKENTGVVNGTVLALLLRREPADTCDVIIDDLQLEEGPLTTYKEYDENPTVSLKVAPSYLNCTGAPSDPIECAQYALRCSFEEAGCEAYTSVSTGRTVNGVISNPASCDPNVPGSCDQCPVAYAGCQAFRELAIDYPPYRPARDPVSFVPTTGQSCPASAVGCEEYTNLEEVAAGGEGREYYSRVQSCVLDTDAQVQSYYTWEGSNEFGFQLREYSLKISNTDNGPCTNVGAEGDPSLGANDWPNCIDNYDIDTAATLPAGNPAIDYPAATCAPAEVGVNPDCAEFYNTSGNTFYRLRSRVIYASADCKSYRNTIDGPDLTYHIIRGQGVSCQAQYAGCRAYKGNAGDNVRLIYEEDFENGTVDPWIGNVSYSTEAASAGGHSMLVATSGAIADVSTSLGMQDDKQYTLSFWARSGAGNTTVTATLNTVPGLTFPGQAFALSSQWQRFELGPLYIPVGTNLAGIQLALSSTNAVYIDSLELREIFENIYLVKDSYTECSGYEGCQQYTDRDGGSHYLKSFTRLCDENHVGCEAMLNTQNTASPYSSTYTAERYLRGDVNYNQRLDAEDESLIRQQAAGAGSYLDNVPLLVGDADSSGAITLADADTVRALVATGALAAEPYYNYDQQISSDAVTFLVNDPAKGCSAAIKGCMAVGEPILNADGTVQNFLTKYIVNDPDDYGDILCQFGENMCEAFTAINGSEYYFKDPGVATCEYKRLSGQDAAGWYTAGTNQGTPNCPISIGICAGGGIDDGKLCNSSDDCQSGFCNRNPNVVSQPTDGWVGTCPASASSCTEYRDPEEVQSENEVVSANFAQNPSFENFTTTPSAATNTDGIIDTQLPDIFGAWANAWTSAGVCSGNASITCNTDQECAPYGGTCNTGGGRVACGMRLLASSDAYAGSTAAAAKVFDACNKGVNSSAVYRCVAADTRVQVEGSNPNPSLTLSNGMQGCQSNADCLNPAEPAAYCQGDPAYYTWHSVQTDDLTDNRSFTASFYAKIDPTDPSCAQDGVNNLLVSSFVRTIDDRPFPDRLVQYLPQLSATVTSAWQRFELTTNFPSVDPADWHSESGPLAEQQNGFQMVLRSPSFGANTCDILLDGFQIAETRDTFDYIPYYYLKDTIDTKSCNGLVDREEGCRLFNDTSLSSLPYSTLLTEDGSPPEPCSNPSECDSNSVIGVNRDRECSRWLECETSVRQENANGKVEELCLSRFICEEMDPVTGQCTKVGEYENVNQTYDTPEFVSKIKNYTGLVLAGLNWDRRCSNNQDITCTSDAQCGEGICSDPQIFEGSLPVAAMSEEGSVSLSGNLIKYGDFGDGDYLTNQELTCSLSSDASGSCTGPTDVNKLPLSDLVRYWLDRGWAGGTVSATWTEEDINNGAVPSPNGNLDENNIARVQTSGDIGAGNANWNGIQYDLGATALFNELYYASFRLKWGSTPSPRDEIRVQFAYVDSANNETGYLTIGDIKPTEEWQEYSIGPARIGDQNGGGAASYQSIRLQIVHHYTGADAVPPVEFYLDDLSLKPVLQTKENNQGLLSRDCRLYPQADAPYCNYTDENNVTHRGWQGYCLEHDPQNPKYCINWWPVDLLKGESNVFGTLGTTGYSGRRPLYMCLQGDDSANRNVTVEGNTTNVYNDYLVKNGSWYTCDNDTDAGEPSDDGVSRSGSPLLGKSFGYSRPFATQWCRHEKGCDGDWNNDDDCDQFGDLENYAPVRNGEVAGIIFGCDTDDSHGCEMASSSINVDPQDSYYKWEIESIAVIAQMWSEGRDGGFPGWDPTYGHHFYNDGNFTPIEGGATPDGPAYFIFRPEDADAHPPNWPCDNCWSAKWSEYSRGGGNYFLMTLYFDANDRLTNIGTNIFDVNDGGSFWALPIVYLKNTCNVVAQVVSDHQDKAWFQRTDQNSVYRTPKLVYTYTQNYSPYGGIIQPRPITLTPSQWTYDPNRFGPLYTQLRGGTNTDFAHAGSPYSFAGNVNTVGRLCSAFVSGSGYTGHNECRNKDDVEKCLQGPDGNANTADDGYCIGTGAGFCQDNALMYCTPASASNDCVDAQGNDFGPCIVGSCEGGADDGKLCGGTCSGGVNNGQVCGQPGDCPGGNCSLDLTYDGGSCAGGFCRVGGDEAGLDLNAGIERAKRLFAYVYGAWTWDDVAKTYVDAAGLIADWQNNYGIPMPVCPYSIDKERADRPNYPNDYCGVPPVVDNILVSAGGEASNSSSTILVGGKTQLSFNIKADPNQKPIQLIEVDFTNDGVPDYSSVGRYDSGTVNVAHEYSQVRTFRPRIRVVDNWEWCGVPANAGVSCPFGDCRHATIDGSACDWVDSNIDISVITP